MHPLNLLQWESAKKNYFYGWPTCTMLRMDIEYNMIKLEKVIHVISILLNFANETFFHSSFCGKSIVIDHLGKAVVLVELNVKYVYIHLL